ncbi:MAG: TIGR03936 family radical SAM-associated protein [Clostridia bacterium]|nr:TIGR03936 family radical SAM-associated protein [Clostridia bacterium]
MLSFGFSKKDDAVFIPHIDIMRALHRTLRRMSIPLDYSKGFNPHMLINLSQPLPLGVASADEWATIQTDFGDPNAFVTLFNANCPPGLACNECHYTTQKPNIAGNVTASEYFIRCQEALSIASEIADIGSRPLFISTRTKTGDVDKDVSSLVYTAIASEDGISLRLAFGNINLRIDKLSEKLNELFGLEIALSDIVRTKQMIFDGKGFISVSDFLKGVQ